MLMYHDQGDHVVTRDQLQYIPTPEPMGPRHKPVSFYDYACLVQEKAQQYGLHPSTEEYVLNKDNMRFFGVITLSSNIGTSGYEFMLGLKGSHDRSVPRGLAIGTRVFVCSNLAFTGDLGTITTKQTLNIDDRIHDFINSGLDMVSNRMSYISSLYDDWKDCRVTPQRADNFLCDLYRKNILPAADLGVALKEWVDPTYKEHEEYGDSLWKLFNACTQSVKPRGANANMFTVSERTHKIHREIEKEFG